MKVGPFMRQYDLYVPRSATGAPAPLVIMLHGGGGNIARARHVGFDKLGAREGFVTVYPQSMAKNWVDGRRAVLFERMDPAIDDVAFIAKLIDRLVASRVADPGRVYVTGVSNGGMMSFRLACALADRLAAVAPVIASMPAPLARDCAPARPLALLVIAATADRLVPYSGGRVAPMLPPDRGRVLSIAGTMAVWRRNNGCAGPGRRVSLPDRVRGDRSHVIVERASGCAKDAPVILYTIEGGGHTWPSTKSGPGSKNRFRSAWLRRLTGPVNRDIEATGVIWRFFQQHRREEKRRSGVADIAR
jgi:polyhydroxybutyrate depolymerase